MYRGEDTLYPTREDLREAKSPCLIMDANECDLFLHVTNGLSQEVVCHCDVSWRELQLVSDFVFGVLKILERLEKS